MNSASLNEIANNIRNLLRGGRSSNDDLMSLDQIKYQIKYYRSLLIRRDMQRNLDRSNSFEQDLGHIELENVDSAESPNFFSGNIISKSKKQIPTPIRLKNSEALTYIAIDDKFGTQIPVLDGVRTSWQQYNKYTSDTSFAVYRDGYLYIYNNISVSRAYVRGIFEDPEQVFEFTDENGLNLYDENSPFPISQDMLQQITQSLINGEGNFLLKTPNDNELDRDSQ